VSAKLTGTVPPIARHIADHATHFVMAVLDLIAMTALIVRNTHLAHHFVSAKIAGREMTAASGPAHAHQPVIAVIT
jgi:nitrogen fixation protein FixH